MNESAVFHRDLHHRPSVAKRGEGAFILADKRYFTDLSSGAGVTCLGHDAIGVKDAIVQQLSLLPYVHSGNWTTRVTEDLASSLLGLIAAGPNDPKQEWLRGGVVFLNSGAEAIEAACKLATQYFHEMQGPKSTEFFGRHHSYHGNSLFTLALGDHPRKRAYTDLIKLMPIARFEAYRPSLGQTVDLGLLEEMLSQNLEAEIGSVVVIEPIGGMTIGIEPPTAEYLVTLRKLCDKYSAVLIYDEVLSGNYRTGHLFSWQHYASNAITEFLDPDIIVAGKGLTAGYFPLSAVIASGKIMDPIRKGSGRLWHSTTNQNHPLGCAASLRALAEYERHKPDTAMLDSFLAFIPTIRSVPIVHSVVGTDMLWGIRLDPTVPDLHKKARAAAMALDVALYTDGGTVAGEGNFLLLAPPYTIQPGHLENAMNRLVDALKTL